MNDDELFARLGSIDPAAELPPADPHRVARLMEAAMSESTQNTTQPTGRRGWQVAVAAAAVAAVAGAGVFFATNGDDDTPPVARDTTEGTVLTLTLPAQPPGRCMVPTADALADTDTAVAATVTGVEGDVITLEVDTTYAGQEADTLQLDAAGPGGGGLGEEESSFVEGQEYLVAATDGQVVLCGFSAEKNPELTQMYSEAFGK